MKDYTYRSIQINGQQFGVTEYNDGRIYVRSIHPYDETEYHWARHLGIQEDYWGIYRDGKFIARSRDFCDGVEVTPEQIAGELLNLDEAANLKRTGGIW